MTTDKELGIGIATNSILDERRRQVTDEGWTVEHDDQHGAGELAHAAAGYASNAGHLLYRSEDRVAGEPGAMPMVWPWDVSWWKPALRSDRPLDIRRDLVKAGALICAEIDKLDRRIIEEINKADPDEVIVEVPTLDPADIVAADQPAQGVSATPIADEYNSIGLTEDDVSNCSPSEQLARHECTFFTGALAVMHLVKQARGVEGRTLETLNAIEAELQLFQSKMTSETKQ